MTQTNWMINRYDVAITTDGFIVSHISIIFVFFLSFFLLKRKRFKKALEQGGYFLTFVVYVKRINEKKLRYAYCRNDSIRNDDDAAYSED
jgi:hypothetical protein